MNRSALRRIGVAATFSLLALGVAAPASAAATGLDGVVVNGLTGDPVANVDIVVQQADGSNWNQTWTDGTGHFTLPDLPDGQYQTEFMANGYVTQWAYGHANQWEADLISAPGAMSVSLMPIQYGTVSGHVTSADGKPLKNVYVELDAGYNGSQVANVATDKSGAYRIPGVQTGQYTLWVRYVNGQQIWYPNTEDPYSATLFDVNPNATTKVNLVQGPVGDLVLRVLDANTGRPLAGACGYYQGGPLNVSTGCSGTDGRIRYAAIPVGSYDLGAFGPNNSYLNGGVQGAVVTADATTTKTIRLKTGASIHFNVIDSATGDPIDPSDVCIGQILPYQNNVGSPGNCGGSFDWVGVWPGTFKLFVSGGYQSRYGAQWVGPDGGTGDPDAARTFSVTYNQHLDVTIKMDGAGTIAGTVTDAATGAPVSGVCPTALGPNRSYGPPFDGACTDQWTTTYQLTGLGPYLWKVAFPDYSQKYAWVWSGDQADRATATPVRVVAGQTVTVNATLRPTGIIAGTVVRSDGGCVQCVSVWAVDADTGDYASVQPYVYPDGTFSMTGLNTGDVWLYYGWNGDTSVRYPTRIHVVAGQTISGITITVPSS